MLGDVSAHQLLGFSDTEEDNFCMILFEPRCEKTGLRGIRPGPTQTGLYSH